MQSASCDRISLKQVKPHHLTLFTKYLSIRHQVFIKEMGRRFVIGEFNRFDFKARHYILQDGDNVIGTARLVHKNHETVQIGRVAVIKKFRNKGYGGIIINKLLEIVKENNFAKIVSLLSEDDKVNFYLRLGFIVDERIFTDPMPLSYMIIKISK